MATYEVDAVRADGGLVHIRPVREDDRAALLALNERSSDESIYRRFFTASRQSADAYVNQLLRPANREHQALVAVIAGEVVGVAAFERLTALSAEIAVLIDDRDQGEGIGTLLLEHLAVIARRCDIERFVGEVLADNAPMIRVIRDLGFEITTRREYGTVHLTFDLTPAAQVVAAIDERERVADELSLRPVLAPRSVAVIGASTREHTIGHQVLRNILDGGFTGTVYVVNPRHDSVLGVASVASARDLPVEPDLAVVAVPASAVLEVVRDCGERGARGILLLTAGFGETGTPGAALQHEVLAVAREYGMRLIGPNCLGLLNTDPAVRLNATFARLPMQPGSVGLVSQSGALGIAVLAAARRYGMYVSQFVSVGNKADVSSNDLLLAWERDERTSVVALYLESFGNPRKFARIARRVSSSKPIIAIKSGRTVAGQRAGRSHTAAAASADAVVDALFTQAGVLRVDSMEQMLDAGRVLADQPLPAGSRVVVIGNSGGPGILAADAAEAAGLTTVELAPATVKRLHEAVPAAPSTQNPIDLGAAVQPSEVAAAMRIVLTTDDVDAVLAVFTETLVADPAEIMAALVSAAGEYGKPVVATQVGGEARSVPMPGTSHRLPVFEFPEPAAAAMGLAHRYAQIRNTPVGEVTRPPDTDPEGARLLIARRLAAGVEWLGPDDVARLLIRYDVPMCPQRIVPDAETAVVAAAELGYPVAVKLARGAVHKTDVGGVLLGISDEAQLRAAVACVQAAGTGGPEVLIQPMVAPGTELIAGAVQDAQFGPVVMLGAGGVLADIIADRQLRLAPLTDLDADAMISGLRSAPLLDGYRGRPVVSRLAVRMLLLRLATLVDDLPEVAELDLNPVVCRGRDDLVVVDAKVRIAPAPTLPDPVLRQLRRP